MHEQIAASFIRWFMAGILILSTVGCARLPLSGKLAETVTPSRLAAIDPGAPVALDPANRLFAFGRDGLRLLDRSTGKETILNKANPAAIAWNPAGTRLAAAFPQGSASQVVLYESGGKEAARTEVSGSVCAISWLTRDELFFAALEVKPFSFGTDRREMLYHWNCKDAPVATILGTTNVKPLTRSRFPWIVSGGLQLVVSPLGDEILFTRFFDPPAFQPYFRIILRHLGTGQEREIASISLDRGRAIFADAETVLYGDGVEAAHLVDPWENRKIASYPLSGHALATSGSLMAIDDHLYENGKEIATIPGSSVIGFTQEGTGMLLRHENSVYLLEGLPKQSKKPEAQQKLLQLRQWRSEGLITPGEYQEMMERILNQ